jgi:integrase
MTKPRRRRGSGSITKRGGSWVLKFELERQPGERRRCRYISIDGTLTKKEARDELARLIYETKTGALPEPSRMTVCQYVGQWLDSATVQSPKTLQEYRGLAERHIYPHLGEIPLQKLAPEAIETWHGKLLGKIAPRTIGHAHRVLSKVLATAARNGTVARNVAALVPVPRVEDTEMKVLSPDEIPVLLDGLKGHPLHPIAVVALGTGMRRGEMLGLQWGDVDLDGATVRVQRSLEETRQGLRVRPPKTKRSRRTIDIDASTVAVLRAHKVATMEYRLGCQAGAIPDDAPVFFNPKGGLLSPDNISRDWRRVCRRLKLPLVRFHDLRHTCASILLASGIPVLDVSRRLGHAKVSTTLDVYGHLMPGADKKAAEAIGRVMG